MVSIRPIIWRTSSKENTTQDSDYFREQIIESNKGDFKEIGISDETIENIIKIVKTEFQGQEEKLTEVTGNQRITKKLLNMDKDWIEELKNNSNNGCFVSISEPSILVVRTPYQNSIFLFGKNSEDVSRKLEEIKTSFYKLNEVTKDFGLELVQFITGKEYAEDQLLKLNQSILTMKFKLSKNKFEEEVIKSIQQIINIVLNNVEIMFDKPTETFEYDIIIPIDTDEILNIEITDYTTLKEKIHETSETIKKELILNTLDKAQRLKAKSIIITKGFPKEIYDSMKELATSRNIILLNDINYIDQIEELIIEKCLNSKSDERHFFSRRSRIRHSSISLNVE